jgi:hypothetical protein
MTPVSQPTNPLPSLENNQMKSKTPAKSKKGKTRSSSTQKASTSKIPKARTPSARKQAKRTTTTGTDESSDGASNPTATRRPRWEDDKNQKGESAMSLLLKWITTYGNWQRYKDGNIVKRTTIQLVIDYLAENGIAPRKIGAVADKV